MKESFAERFNNRKWKNKAINELNRLRLRKDEPIRKYAAAFKKACNRIEGMTPVQQVEYFMRGLTQEMASLVLTHGKENLKDIIDLIERYEEGQDITSRSESKPRRRKERYYESETDSESESENE